MEIPAVVGIGPFLTDVSGGDVVIVDGDRGQVILQPDEETLARYRRDEEQHRSHDLQLAALRDLPAITCDGEQIDLFGNIEFPHEVRHCLSRGAGASACIGPSFSIWAPIRRPTKRGISRLIPASSAPWATGRSSSARSTWGPTRCRHKWPSEEEKNPFLGLRSIRLALRNLPIFRTQLRAILRASTLGDVRVMFPLIATLLELRQAKMVLADVMEDLDERGQPFNRDMPVGMMVEVPSAVLMIDHFVEEVDFLSIGTNDLIQYTLAVDRSNKDVADLYNASDPAVLKLVKIAIDSALRHDKSISLCGQMSGEFTYTMLLLGLGLRQLSVAAAAIPEIKRSAATSRSINVERWPSALDLRECPRRDELSATRIEESITRSAGLKRAARWSPGESGLNKQAFRASAARDTVS